MLNKEQLALSAAAAFLMLMTTQSALADSLPNTQKCYGVVRAGLNDCSTATASCAGSSTKDAQADAFILTPKGLCEKLVGGRLTAEEKK